jgi:toxin ParE1/3/4
LLERPEIGQARPEIGAEIRCFPHRKYLILYQIIPAGAEIVRVVHGARDLSDIA